MLDFRFLVSTMVSRDKQTTMTQTKFNSSSSQAGRRVEAVSRRPQSQRQYQGERRTDRDKEVAAQGGNFILDWYEGGSVCVSRRQDAADAINQRDRKVAELTAASNGLTVTNGDPTKRLVSDAAEEYLADIEAHNPRRPSLRTEQRSRTSASLARRHTSKTLPGAICCVQDVLADEKEQSDRSVWNKFSAVMGFLKSVGHTGKNIGVVKHDWPEYDEETPEVYEDDELVKFYAACDEDEARWFRFFELTGMREGEVQHCQWSLD